MDTFLGLCNKYVPTIKKSTKARPRWISGELKTLTVKKRRLWYVIRSSSKPEIAIDYKNTCKNVASMIKRDVLKFENDLVEKY